MTAVSQGFSHISKVNRRGAVAQLGARVNGIHEVAGSIPASSTKHREPATGIRRGCAPFVGSMRAGRFPSARVGERWFRLEPTMQRGSILATPPTNLR